MERINIGIIGGADIAYKRFLPALIKNKNFFCSGIASTNEDRRSLFSSIFNIDTYEDYNMLLESKEVQALYIPLPSGMHYKWAKKALLNHKHVFLEKPATINHQDTLDLITVAKKSSLVLHENYMFVYHKQIETITNILKSGRIGDIHMYRASFSFPFRGKEDFRYDKDLGGGAIFDAGGYVTKLATILLGNSIKVKTACLNFNNEFGVDMFGSVTFSNDDGITFQGSFGMDDYYQCSLEVFGKTGKVKTNRIFTPPIDYSPEIIISDSQSEEVITVSPEDHFGKSIDMFYAALESSHIRNKLYTEIEQQSRLIDCIIQK